MTVAARDPRRAYAVPIGDIVAGLARRAESLARELLPRGRREGLEWRVGGVSGEPGRSMAVHLGGGKAGVWSDFSSGERGDALDLVAAVLCRGDKREAVAWALRWLGREPEPSQRAGTRQAPTSGGRQADGPGRPAETHASAFRMFLEARPKIGGTVAEAYLRGRGIELARLGRQPAALRFQPRLRHPCGLYFPALIAGINRAGADARWKIVAVHRTWLAPDGSGKAPVPAQPDGRPWDVKMSLGGVRGGLIPLWRGRSGKSLREAPAGDTIVLAEGIEDGLSCAIADPSYRVAAAISLANMGNIELPPAIETVIIAAQNDPWFDARGGREHGARRGLDRAIANFQRQRKRVLIARPAHGKDMNDLLRRAG